MASTERARDPACPDCGTSMYENPACGTCLAKRAWARRMTRRTILVGRVLLIALGLALIAFAARAATTRQHTATGPATIQLEPLKGWHCELVRVEGATRDDSFVWIWPGNRGVSWWLTVSEGVTATASCTEW